MASLLFVLSGSVCEHLQATSKEEQSQSDGKKMQYNIIILHSVGGAVDIAWWHFEIGQTLDVPQFNVIWQLNSYGR